MTAKNKNDEKYTAVSACKAIQVSIRMGVLIALTLFLLTGAWGIRNYIHTGKESAEIAFTGTGEHFIENTTAKITFTFSDRQHDISQARDTVTARVQSAYAILARANIADKDIQTTDYTIYPEYEYATPEIIHFPTKKRSELLGYRVSHTTATTIRDIAAIGTILTALTDLNPETVTGPIFSADEEQGKQAKNIATVKAIRDARARAHTIAQSADLHLKKITRINIYESGERPYARLESAAMAFDGVTQQAIPIQQGEQKIQQTAVITYEVKEKRSKGNKK